MPQIGSDDKQNAVPLRRSIYRNAAGKGAKPRPREVSKQQYEDNWDKIFGKKKNQTKEQSWVMLKTFLEYKNRYFI